MVYTNLKLLRKELADPFKYAFERQTGDGETVAFKLSHGNVQDGTYKVFVDNDLKTETTDYTIDKERGLVTFKTAPLEKEEIEVEYYFAAFSDEELEEFLALESDNVVRAALRGVNLLIADASRRFDYASGQTEMKPSQVFEHLKDLRKIFQERLRDSHAGVALVDRSSRFYDKTTTTETDLSREDLK